MIKLKLYYSYEDLGEACPLLPTHLTTIIKQIRPKGLELFSVSNIFTPGRTPSPPTHPLFTLGTPLTMECGSMLLI